MSEPTHAIGRDGLIPWHIPEDFKRFRELTFNHPLIMGRKTFESISEKVRPLPGRLNIVVTRDEATLYRLEEEYEMLDKTTNTGFLVTDDIGRAILAAEVEGKVCWDTSEVFIIGGESIYRHVLDEKLVDKMYLTYIEQEIQGDVHFPMFDKKAWEHKLVGLPKSHMGLSYTFWEYIAPWAPKLNVEHSE